MNDMTGTGQKLYQHVAASLEALIRQGRFGVDSRLPGERELAEEFQVSRPTIREAMIALEIRGFVASRHGSGVYVRDRTSMEANDVELDVGAFELIEARAMFEGEAAALAAKTISDADLDRLDEILVDMASREPASQDAYDADKAFHLLIAQATSNTLVRSTIDTLWSIRERSPLCIHMFLQASREGINPRVDEHRLILEALRLRDPIQARAMMHAHLYRVTDDLLAATELELIENARQEAEAQRKRVTNRTIHRG